MRIGFIGLGNMGTPMAHNLLGAGHEVAVFDIAAERMAAFADVEAATAAADARDACRGADFVISMLPASEHVEALYLTDGLLDAIDPSTIVVDCSTIAAATSRTVATAAADLGIRMLDAPVSGGTAGASAGTLTFMVGGDAATLGTARPVLECMGANIFHAGPAGAGQTAKACNNMLLAAHMIATAEALSLGVAQGLDPAVLSSIMCQSSGGNWTLATYNPWPGIMDNVPASRGYQGGFAVALMIKDLGLALEAANETATPVAIGSLCRELYLKHREQNDAGSLDFSSILRLIAQGSSQSP